MFYKEKMRVHGRDQNTSNISEVSQTLQFIGLSHTIQLYSIIHTHLSTLYGERTCMYIAKVTERI